MWTAAARAAAFASQPLARERWQRGRPRFDPRHRSRTHFHRHRYEHDL